MSGVKAKQVRNYVQALNLEDRYIVMLYYADGLTPMEISRVLNMQSSAVRSRLKELQIELACLTQPKTHAASAASQSPEPRSNSTTTTTAYA